MTLHEKTASLDFLLSPETVPSQLRDLPQWLVWSGKWGVDQKTGKPKRNKAPRSPGDGRPIDPTDPKSWATFEVAAARARELNYAGVGFCLTGNDGLVGVDLDNALDEEGGVVEWAQPIVEALPSIYWEISPSKRGLRGFAYGALPTGGRRTIDVPGEGVDPIGKIEFYDDKRFLTVTGWRFEDSTDGRGVVEAQAEIDEAYAIAFSEKDEPKVAIEGATTTVEPPTLTDDEILDKLNGAKNAQKSIDLWQGKNPPGKSDSEGDASFLWQIAFYTTDPAQVERIARMSERERAKWDEPRGDERWIDREIRDAIDKQTNRYDPSFRSGSTVIREGPLGLKAKVLEVAEKRGRMQSVTLAVERGREKFDFLTITRARNSQDEAVKDLMTIVSTRDKIDDREKRGQIKRWLQSFLADDSLGEKLNEGKSTVLEILRRDVVDPLALAFTDDNDRLWSETRGRFMTRGDVSKFVTPRVVEACRLARDYEPEKTSAEIHGVEKILSTIFSELLEESPREPDADLGPGSKAAARLRQRLIEAWTKPQTFERKQDFASNATLAHRALERCRGEKLIRVHDGGFAAWARTREGKLELAMRVELFRQSKVPIDESMDHRAFAKVLQRYGLGCPGGRAGAGGQKVTMLESDLVAEILETENANPLQE